MNAEISRAAKHLSRALSMSITKRELAEAVRSTQNKLQAIIKAEGDANGKRLESWYFEELVVEEIRNRRMGAFATAAAQLFTVIDADGQKETVGATNTKPPVHKNNLVTIVA